MFRRSGIPASGLNEVSPLGVCHLLILPNRRTTSHLYSHQVTDSENGNYL